MSEKLKKTGEGPRGGFRGDYQGLVFIQGKTSGGGISGGASGGLQSAAMSEKSPKPVVTRFAPSPTGALHVGGARTALFAWAFARQHNGQFILRMEDTDQARSSDQAAQDIMRDLKWLNLDWDAGPTYQSQRLDIYTQYIKQLCDAGLAYPDDGAVRFRMDKHIAFEDAVFGRISVEAIELEDFVIQKADGFPTFHLAVIVDDALMGVTHVIRGQEHLSNTAKHVALLDALGLDRPVYAHTPSIMNPDGSKMSKRDKAKVARKAAKEADSLGAVKVDALELERFLDKKSDDMTTTLAIAEALGLTLPEIDVADFRDSGYLPQALLNYLALLGWNPGNNVERFDMAFLVSHFSLDRIGKSNAKFDRDKLFRFNAQAVAELPAETFEPLLKEHLQKHHTAFDAICADESKFKLFCQAYQSRARTLDEVATLGQFFIAGDDELVFNAKAVKKNLLKNEGEGLSLLAAFADELEALEPWSGEAAHGLIHSFCEKREMNMGKIAGPLRVALTGSGVSPDMDATLEILGKTSTMARIRQCLATVKVKQAEV